MPGVAARDCPKQGDGDLRRVSQPRSHPSTDWDPAAVVGIEGGAVSERKELAQTAVRIREPEKAILGSASMGSRILGGDQRERDG